MSIIYLILYLFLLCTTIWFYFISISLFCAQHVVTLTFFFSLFCPSFFSSISKFFSYTTIATILNTYTPTEYTTDPIETIRFLFILVFNLLFILKHHKFFDYHTFSYANFQCLNLLNKYKPLMDNHIKILTIDD